MTSFWQRWTRRGILVAVDFPEYDTNLYVERRENGFSSGKFMYMDML